MTIDLAVKRLVLSVVQFPRKTSLDNIARHIRTIKGTGALIVHFSQGGINAVTFESRNSLDGHNHVELKFNTPTLP